MLTSPIFTVGHSNHPIDRFLALLAQHRINVVVDVRSSPYSRWHPQFGKDKLKDSLGASGIEYVFLGQELGARRDEPEAYEGHTASYERIARLPAFQRGLDQIRKQSAHDRLALMCAEADPLTCHRAILVCRHLRQFSDEIFHILKSGELEPHGALEGRLLKTVGRDSAQDGLFEEGESALDQAYRLRNAATAYQSKNPRVG